ncbi:luciferase family protein [Streptomyces gilvosporeus]|uniref:luciferase domain-containing protein n=1 Tax=Streptomyces gilvosporeus TaxID=553510 RepID=UPI0026D8AB06
MKGKRQAVHSFARRDRRCPARSRDPFTAALLPWARSGQSDDMNLAEHANARLADWPALSRGRACCGARHCLCAGAQEIVHFHGGNEVDVHLTHGMIERLRPALRKSSAIKLPTASGWITVRLEAGSDIDLLATLVSAALLATGSRSDLAEAAPTDPCTLGSLQSPHRRPGRRARPMRWGRTGKAPDGITE